MILPDFCFDSPVVKQDELAPRVFRLTLRAPEIAQTAKPGEFVMLRAAQNSPVTLRRPLGIAAVHASSGDIDLIYRVMGKGTEYLSRLKPGDGVNVLGSLGSGFSLEAERPLLIGGGMGLSPLLFYAQASGRAEILMGGKNAGEMFWSKLFEPFAKKIYVTTDDGSVGHKGFTVSLLPDLLENKYDLAVVCGPEVMMQTTAKILREAKVPCQISLERRMACGLGACLSCSIDTKSGRRKVCKDGPVFWAEEVYF